MVKATHNPLYPRGKRNSTHRTGDCVGPRADVAGCGKSHPHRHLIPDPPGSSEPLSGPMSENIFENCNLRADYNNKNNGDDDDDDNNNNNEAI